MLTSDQKGGIAEMGIAWHATKLGVDVYKPVTEHSTSRLHWRNPTGP
jgi:hypothetical protein